MAEDLSPDERDELARATAAYAERDAAPASPLYAWSNPAYVLYMQRLERELLRALAVAGVDLAHSRVLDIGSGSGYFAHRLAEYGAREVCGIDLMPARVEEGRRRYPGLDLRAGSATDLPFEDASFDVVSQFTCLSSVLDAGVRAAIGAEMFRVLRPGGVVVSFDMAPTPALLRSIARLARRLRRTVPDDTVTATESLSAEELLRILPGELVVCRSPTLDFDLTQRLGGRPRTTELLASVPMLRTHLLTIIRKPSHPKAS